MTIPELRNSPYHGTEGYLTVENFRSTSLITDAILKAGRQMGYNITDVNGKSQTGFTQPPGTIKDGLRCSTARCYLRPVESRVNLHISLNSYVEKILIDETTMTAVGVRFQKTLENNVNVTKIIRARKEVILSAGAIQTPQVRSGLR